MIQVPFLAPLLVLAALALPLAAPALRAEIAVHGDVELTGLARETSWPLNPPGPSFVMVCNVDGPDGFLSVRSGPGTEFPVRRNFERLAILAVDTSQRKGHWVRITDARRQTTPEGRPLPGAGKPLAVEGWAHDGHLCDFLD